MPETNYWHRLAARRLSRRQMLARAAGVGAGLAALSLAGCGGGGGETTGTPGASCPPIDLERAVLCDVTITSGTVNEVYWDDVR